MKILTFPHPSLFTVCKEVSVFGPELKTLLNAMWDAMELNNGIGIASNQVGLDYSMFVMKGPEVKKFLIVNPKIVKESSTNISYKEGCLSAPGELVTINNRASWVTIDYQNEDGLKTTTTFHGLFAVCVQHEIEHLQGKSFLQSKSLPRAKRREYSSKWGLKGK